MKCANNCRNGMISREVDNPNEPGRKVWASKRCPECNAAPAPPTQEKAKRPDGKAKAAEQGYLI